MFNSRAEDGDKQAGSATTFSRVSDERSEYGGTARGQGNEHGESAQGRRRNISDATKILASLTTRFSTLQVAWDNVDPARQTLDNLQERLIREDARLNSDEDALEALAATAKNQRPKGAKNTENKKTKKKKESKELQCYKCQEMGHIARQCQNKRKPHDDGGKSRDCAFVVETSKSSVTSNSKSAKNVRVL